MSKESVVSSAVSSIQSALAAAQAQVLSDGAGAVYDSAFAEGVASVPVSTGGGSGDFTQADIDAAVKAQSDSDSQALAQSQAADQAALQAAQASAQAQLDQATQALADMTAKEGVEEGAVAALSGSLDAVQKALDGIKALLFPSPAPAPTPAPVPTDGSAPSA